MINYKKFISLTIALAALTIAGCKLDKTKTGKTTKPSTDIEIAFPLSVKVFDIPIRGTGGTPKSAMIHAANVMAQYLDNNEDGIPDNQAVVDHMVDQGATLLMASNQEAFDKAAENTEPKTAYQDLLADEVKPNGRDNNEFDTSLEEVLHLITHVGFAGVYPENFGEHIDTEIANAMDKARGGRFETIPQSYPSGAWYTYSDDTCDYSCMVTEYTYWALTSILGAQDFTGRLDAIRDEWSLNTKEKVKNDDPAIFSILTNPDYGLPTKIPTGNYKAKTFVVSGTATNGTDTPSSENTPEILQAAQAANINHKIAYGDTVKIWMMNPDGTGVTELADGSPISGYVSWGAEAKYVYFASAKGTAGSAWEAFRVDVETKKLTQLSQFDQDVRSLAVSPDGRYLAISIMSGNSNINDNNDNLKQFTTDLYIIEMSDAENKWASGNKLIKTDMRPLVTSLAAEKFWYEELNWNPNKADGDMPVLTYTRTYSYDEDDISYGHVYSIKADGTEKQLLIKNKDQPIWSVDGSLLTFLDFSSFDPTTKISSQLKVSGITGETSAPAISPDGQFMIFEVGDENRKAGMARVSREPNNEGVMIGDLTIYEPRWSPVPVY